MDFRATKRAKKGKEVQDYEHNLKLFLNSKQSEIETILRVSMPHQLSNMKTILWLNFLLVGFSLHLLQGTKPSMFYLSFFIASFISTCSIVIALLNRRYKHYGTIGDIDYMSKYIPDNEWAKSTAIAALIKHTDDAINANKAIMKYLAKYMHFATWTTLAAIALFILSVYTQIYTKGGDEQMAKKPTPTTVVAKPTVGTTESSERSIKTPPPKPKQKGK